MIIQLLGWLAALTAAIGFLVLAKRKILVAQILFIISNSVYVIYNIHISNWSHLSLIIVITIFNVVGLKRELQIKKKENVN